MTAMGAAKLRTCAAASAQFLAEGAPLRAGAMLRQPNLGRTLQAIADGGDRAFYEGEIADRIARAFAEAGGLLAKADLAATEAEELEPAATSYRGYTVHEQPPVSQGFIVLESLNIVEQFDLAAMDTATRVHVIAESQKLAFDDRFAHLGDPRLVDVPLARLVSKAHARERAALIDLNHALPFNPPSNFTIPGDTTYLCAMDGEGNAVSLIQSVFAAYGSAFVAGDTGVLFNNRLSGFALEAGHPNELAPGKRTVHTLNTYLATRDGHAAIVGGTPGVDRQVQTNVQVLTNLIDLGMDAQTALDAPRWSIAPGLTLQLEAAYPDDVRIALAERGHRVTSLGPWSPLAGRAQLIVVDAASGARMGASDLRGEGQPSGL
jgi:gamma-glutamyltranspeptidase/glutathione hydrolase